MVGAVSSLLVSAYAIKKIELGKGEIIMTNLPEKPEIISRKAVDLLVSNAFRKNGVDLESVRRKLSEDQKSSIKEMIEELTQQVDAFVKPKSSEK